MAYIVFAVSNKKGCLIRKRLRHERKMRLCRLIRLLVRGKQKKKKNGCLRQVLDYYRYKYIYVVKYILKTTFIKQSPVFQIPSMENECFTYTEQLFV